jgi:hypothetical protein
MPPLKSEPRLQQAIKESSQRIAEAAQRDRTQSPGSVPGLGWLARPGFRAALEQAERSECEGVAADVHLREPVCTVMAGQVLTDMCACGHMVSAHRKTATEFAHCDLCRPADREPVRLRDVLRPRSELTRMHALLTDPEVLEAVLTDIRRQRDQVEQLGVMTGSGSDIVAAWRELNPGLAALLRAIDR